jgi:hypothetical protein
MKRVILSTCLFLGAQFSILSNDAWANYKPIQKRESFTENGSYMINCGRMLKSTYNILNDNLDYLLTSKGVTKTMIVLAPFVILYGRYFGLDPVKDVGRSLLQGVGRIQAYYELQKVIGANQQLLDEIKSQPWKMFCVATVELVKSIGKKIKVPFIS